MPAPHQPGASSPPALSPRCGFASLHAGFTHSAFTFGYESSITRTQIDPNNVPPGSLITFIQKGMQFLELEANLDEQVNWFDSIYSVELGPGGGGEGVGGAQ